jgi:hypothetical protein
VIDLQIAHVKLERVKGIEASTDNPQSAENKCVTCDCDSAYTQIRAQIEKPADSDLAKVISAWPMLPAPLKACSAGVG